MAGGPDTTMDFDNYPKSICVLVSFIMSPLNAMDDKKIPSP